MQITTYTRDEWKKYSLDAHKIAFSEIKDPECDRIDFALVVGDKGIPYGYVTCRENERDTLYWQFGGAFPGTKDTARTFVGYKAFVEWVRLAPYKRITTLIENTNTVMLKMAMKVGFRIVGIKYYRGSVLVEHLLEFT